MLAGLLVLAVFLLVEASDPRSGAVLIARLPAPGPALASDATSLASLPQPRATARELEESATELAREPLAEAPKAVMASGFTVRVQDPARQPVAAARIELWSQGRALHAGVSAEDGSFALSELAAGIYSVRAEADSFAPALPTPVDRFDGEPRELVIQLGPGVSVTGSVRSVKGMAAAGADVRLVPLLLIEEPSGFERLTRADAQGNFNFERVTFGSYLLAAHHPQAGRGQVANLRVRGGVRPQSLVLTPVGRITGRVRSREGSPIAGASIRAVGRARGDPTPRTVTSDFDGAFSLEDLSQGSYAIDVDARGFAPVRAQSAHSGATDVDIRLGPVVPVRGRVFDAVSGEPLQHFRLSVRTFHPRQREVTTRTVRDSGGTFLLEDLVPGNYTLEIQAEGYARTSSTPITLAEGHSCPALVFGLVRGGSVLGVVLGADLRGAGGADIQAEFLSPIDGSWVAHGARARSNPDGSFKVDFTEAGRYRLTVLHDEHAPAWSKTLEVGALAESPPWLQIRLRRMSTLAVQLVDAEGRALGDVELDLSPKNLPDFPSASQRTDSEGRARFLRMPAGAYRLRALADGAAPDEGRRELAGVRLNLGPDLVHEVTLRQRQ